MTIRNILLAAAVVAAPGLASAQDSSATVSANIGAASEYIWRGASQNIDDGPQFFAGVDVSAGMFYAGTWGSNVDFGPDTATFEWDVYAGVKPTVGPVTFDFGILGYLYPQDDALNTWEAKAAGTIASEAGASLTGSIFYSPEVGEGGPSSFYYELAGSAPIPNAKLGPFSLAVAASVGRFDYESNPALADYTNYRLGVTASTENGWAIDVFYSDTDVDNVELLEGVAVVQLKKTF